ncbi:hypothetical protein Tco_0873781 [Tanacetum coccineum]|uniref:Uncharacterized protein n=1 Tax=Tanacetum coccineum TaxID=301880 RepID=A0ABQ5BJS5_9ASTR
MGRRHLRVSSAAGNCFKCGHGCHLNGLARRTFGASSSVMRKRSQIISGIKPVSLALTQDQAANTSAYSRADPDLQSSLIAWHPIELKMLRISYRSYGSEVLFARVVSPWGHRFCFQEEAVAEIMYRLPERAGDSSKLLFTHVRSIMNSVMPFGRTNALLQKNYYGSAERLKASTNMAKPTSVAEVNDFLGLAGYEVGYDTGIKVEERDIRDLERFGYRVNVFRGQMGYWATEGLSQNLKISQIKTLREETRNLAIIQNIDPLDRVSIDDDGILWQKFFKENEKKILSGAGDGVRIYPDSVVIFDEKKLGNS